MEHITIAWPAGFALVALLSFVFAASSGSSTRVDRKSGELSVRSAALLVGFACLVIAGSFIWSNGEGVPISGKDPAAEVKNLAAGHTYETVWQSEDGKHVLLKKENGSVLYYTFSATVPKKFLVSDKKTLVPVEK